MLSTVAKLTKMWCTTFPVLKSCDNFHGNRIQVRNVVANYIEIGLNREFFITFFGVFANNEEQLGLKVFMKRNFRKSWAGLILT